MPLESRREKTERTNRKTEESSDVKGSQLWGKSASRDTRSDPTRVVLRKKIIFI